MLLLLLSEFEAEPVGADFKYSVWDYFSMLMVPNVNIYYSAISLQDHNMIMIRTYATNV